MTEFTLISWVLVNNILISIRASFFILGDRSVLDCPYKYPSSMVESTVEPNFHGAREREISDQKNN